MLSNNRNNILVSLSSCKLITASLEPPVRASTTTFHYPKNTQSTLSKNKKMANYDSNKSST